MPFSTIIKLICFNTLLLLGTSSYGQNEVLSKVQFPFIPGQELDTLSNGNFPSYSYSYVLTSYYDTIYDVLYAGGWFKQVDAEMRSCIAAFDLRTGKLLPWNVKIEGGLKHVYCINRHGDTLFIAGDFKKVNGITCPSLAAVSASSGQLLDWRPFPDSSVKSICINGSKLYVGGHFHQIGLTSQSYLAIFDLNNLTLSSSQPVIPDSLRGCNNITVYNNKIYFMSQPGSFNSIWFGANVESLNLDDLHLNPSLTNPISSEVYDFNVVNNSLFWTGWGQVNSKNKLGLAINLSTEENLPWDPQLYSENKINSIIWTILVPYKKSFYSGTKSIVGLTDETSPSSLSRYSMEGFGEIEKIIKQYPGINVPNPKLNTVLFDFFTVGNDKLIVFDRIYHYKRYVGDSIHVYCLAAPLKPSTFQTYSTTVCKGQKKVTYSLPQDKKYTLYSWKYSGGGAIIKGTDNSITIDFEENATAGVLSVSGFNQCDMESPPLELNISIAPNPTVKITSKGPLTCTQPQTQLTASSPASVNYSWNGPNNFNSTQANVQVNQQGWYRLKITDQSNDCSTTDSVLVKADTAKPKASLTANTYTLTCNQPKISVTGSTLTSVDSLQWLTATGAILPNPLTVSTPGQYIFLARNKTNGCQSSLPLTIGSNTVHPQLSLPTAIDTLTCKKNSVVVSFSSSTVNANLYLQSATGTIYNNPATLTEAGNYTALVSDPVNGCISKATITIPEDRVIPFLNLPTHQLALTCSNPYTFIKASSTHDSITVNWKNDADSLFVNPLFITKPGTYKVIASNPYNGCSNSDQVIATFKNELLVSAGSNVNLCPDNGSVSLQATVTDPYHYAGALTYNWEPSAGTDATATVKPKTTTTYQLSVKSSKGCEGKSQVTVTVLPAMQDSLSITHPCFTNDGKVNIKIKNNNYPPYTYWATDTSSNIIKPVQDSATFVNLKGFTSYYFFIKDNLGCIKQTSKVQLGALAKAPVIDFLVSSYLMSKDTFVLVNISEPLPDKVVWEIDKATILYSDNHKAIAVRTDTGLVAASLQASYGRCTSTSYKTIRITPYDSTQVKEDKLKGIRLLNLSPNPNSGKFTINLKLGVKQNFTLVVYDALGIVYYQEKLQNSDSYQKEVDLNLLPGTYILKVIATYDVRQKAFLVNDN